MTFNKHYLGVILRIFLLVVASWAAVYLIVVKHLYLSAGLLLIIVLVQVIELLRLIRRTNRELTRLFDSIRNNDFSLHFAERSEGSGFRELHSSFNTLIDAYKKVKLQKEQHYQQLLQVIEFLNTGVLSFDENGDVHLMNSSATETLGIPELRKWSLIKERLPDWTRQIELLPFHEQRSIEVSEADKNFIHLVYKGKVRIGNADHTIISFQGIKDEVERQEIQAYHKLIRILTHEIMNSVTPISSLSHSLKDMLQSQETQKLVEVHELDSEMISDLYRGMRTISNRSEGLLRFVEDYRKLTRIPKPDLTKVSLETWWANQQPILMEMVRNTNIQTHFEDATRNKMAFFDQKLIEQVLINLTLNAIDAVESVDAPEIAIGVAAHGEHWKIWVQDNGPGIPMEKRGQIFIPFFSTKSNGSGIGLSLSRSIIQAHRGKIHFSDGKGTTRFEVSLPISPQL